MDRHDGAKSEIRAKRNESESETKPGEARPHLVADSCGIKWFTQKNNVFNQKPILLKFYLSLRLSTLKQTKVIEL